MAVKFASYLHMQNEEHHTPRFHNKSQPWEKLLFCTRCCTKSTKQFLKAWFAGQEQRSDWKSQVPIPCPWLKKRCLPGLKGLRKLLISLPPQVSVYCLWDRRAAGARALPPPTGQQVTLQTFLCIQVEYGAHLVQEVASLCEPNPRLWCTTCGCCTLGFMYLHVTSVIKMSLLAPKEEILLLHLVNFVQKTQF